MANTTISFDISSEILASLNEDASELSEQVRVFAALQLYKNHKLSFGKAIDLAGIGREDFLTELKRNGIDFINYKPSDLQNEITRFNQ